MLNTFRKVLQELEKLLTLKDKKILFAGVGNVLKKDDGVGVYISSAIVPGRRIMSLTVEVSLENYIGKINSIRPDILVIVDCVDLQKSAGSCRLFSVNELTDTTFNTHNISIQRLSDFFDFPVFILGIQPENIDFGENISYLVKEVADKIIQLINKQEV